LEVLAWINADKFTGFHNWKKYCSRQRTTLWVSAISCLSTHDVAAQVSFLRIIIDGNFDVS
jgi:hypothetical protein